MTDTAASQSGSGWAFEGPETAIGPVRPSIAAPGRRGAPRFAGLTTNALLIRAAVGILVGIAGAVINLYPLQSDFGLNLFLGGVGTFALLRVGGRLSTMIAAVIIGIGSIAVMGHAYGAIVLIGEAAFCLWLKETRRIDPLLAAPLYWLVAGLPAVALFYGGLLDEPPMAVVGSAANLGINGLTNVALGSLLASLAMSLMPALRIQRRRSMWVATAEILVPFTIIPVVLFSAFAGPQYLPAFEVSARATVSNAVQDALSRTEVFLAEVGQQAATLGIRAQRPTFGADGTVNFTLPFAVDRIFVADLDRTLIAALNSSGVTRYADGEIRMPELGSIARLHDQVDEYDNPVPVLTVDLTSTDGALLGWAIAVIDGTRLASYVLPSEPIPNVGIALRTERNNLVGVVGRLPDAGAPDDIAEVATIQGTGWRVEASYDAAAFAEERDLRSAQFLGLMLLIIAAAGGSSFVIARFSARPLERLAQSVTATGSAGSSALPVTAGVAEADALASAVASSRAETARFTEENRLLSERFTTLVRHSTVKIYALAVRDGALEIAYASPGLEAIFGLVPGTAAAALHQRVHADDLAHVARYRDRLLNDGRFVAEYRVVGTRGETVWVSEVAALTRDVAGTPVEVVGMLLDMTERKLVAAQMQHGAKLINLGQMAAALAHEVNQPLNVIRIAAANARTALRRAGIDDARTDFLQERMSRIEAQVERATELIDHVKIFGRIPDARTEPFAVEAATMQALELVEAQVRVRQAQLSARYDFPGATVIGSAQRLEQVVINLVLNALDAVAPVSGRRGAPLPLAEGVRRIDVAVYRGADETVLIEVADSGGGIAPEVLDRIFEPFVTTKPEGAGTGLGLSVSKAIVDEMGGTISATNGAGGAVFRIELPLATPIVH